MKNSKEGSPDRSINKGVVPQRIPDGDFLYLPLRERLQWALANPLPENHTLVRQDIALRTDRLRMVLQPWYAREGVGLLTQLQLIGLSHLQHGEHYLLSLDQIDDLVTHDLYGAETIAGVFRSPDGFPVQNGLGQQVPAPHFRDVPVLMEKLGEKAEILFPHGDRNNKVTARNVYFYVTAFQYLVAAIHPLFETNGRSSEDFMYSLWARRPDLVDSVRYVSSTGTRSNPEVARWDDAIKRIAAMQMLHIVKHIVENDLKRKPTKLTWSYKEMYGRVKASKEDPDDFQDKYYTLLARRLGNFIDRLDSILEKPHSHELVRPIARLAVKLKDCSPIYTPTTHYQY